MDIDWKVAGQRGPVVPFKTNRQTPLSKLTKACCDDRLCQIRI
jgi:hypothetical protein